MPVTLGRYTFDCNPPEDMKVFSPEYLARFTTTCVGQSNNLKLELEGRLRYWLSRSTYADGELYQVYVERLRNGRWEPLVRYRKEES